MMALVSLGFPTISDYKMRNGKPFMVLLKLLHYQILKLNVDCCREQLFDR